MRLVLDGDAQAAGSFVGFAKNKARLLPATADQIYKIDSGVLIRIQKLKGNTTIYIHAGVSLGYQFTIPFSIRDYPSDLRLNQTVAKYVGGLTTIATEYGLNYENEDGVVLAPPALARQPIGGSALMNVWWGEDREYIAVSTPQTRYGLGFMTLMNFSAYLASINYVARPVIRRAKKSPVTIEETVLINYAIAGAMVPDSTGAKREVFVVWDYESSDGVDLQLAVRQPDSTFLIYALSLPSWCAPTTGDDFPHNYFCFNRQGTRLAGTIATYRPEFESSVVGKRYITGFVEWGITINVSENGAVPSITLLADEHDEAGFIRYVAADYRWDEDAEGVAFDTLVVVKIRAELSQWFSSDIGDYNYQYRMMAAYAEWFEWIEGVESPAYRSIQVFDGPAMAHVTDEGNEIYSDIVPDGMFFREYINLGYFGGGLSNAQIDAVHMARHGYLTKTGTISALDLRADAYVITQAARLDSSIVTMQSIIDHPRAIDYRCFDDEGHEIIETIQLGGTMWPLGEEPPPYSTVGSYANFNSGHSEAGNTALRMPPGNEYSFSLYALFNTIVMPAASLDFEEVLRTDFIAIHPDGHWAAYAQYPERWMYAFPLNQRNGFIGVETNNRLFDTIRTKLPASEDPEAEAYEITSHIEQIATIWGSTDLVDGNIETSVDGYIAIAAAGIWAL